MHASDDSNDQHESRLSALLDGELGEFETQRLLQQLDQYPDGQRETIKSRWSRYQVVREVLAGERGNSIAAQGFAASVSAVLAAESAPVVEGSEADQDVNFRAPLWSRVAVAASVAVAVVFGVQQYQGGAAVQQAADLPVQVASVDVISTGSGLAGVARTASLGGGKLTPAPAVAAPALADPTLQAVFAEGSPAPDVKTGRERLHRYLLHHANSAARQGGQGITPFARVYSFESE